MGPTRILIVDDEEQIRRLLSDFLRFRGYAVERAGSTSEALSLMQTRAFEVVITDIRMPGQDGVALLQAISDKYTNTGVIMLSGCDEVKLAVKAMQLGALDYITKPFHLEDVESILRSALARHHENQDRARHIEHLEITLRQQTLELRETLGHLQEASEVTLDALVAALDAREHETQAHSKRVSEYSVRLASALGVNGPDLETVRQGAMLHDIGKIGISDAILMKPASLTDSEWTEMRKHPQIGSWIVSGVDSLRAATSIVLCHHERFDGTGYPQGLAREEIPLGARVFAVADTLDAITSNRPYKNSRSYEEACREISANSGTQFDPHVVECFRNIPSSVWDDIRIQVAREAGRSLPEFSQVV